MRSRNLFFIAGLSIVGLILMIAAYKKAFQLPRTEFNRDVIAYTKEISGTKLSIDIPKQSIIEEKLVDDIMFITIKQPGEYYLDQSSVEIQVQIIDQSESSLYEPRKFIEEDKKNESPKTFVSGVLPEKIDGLPTYEFYSLRCNEPSLECEKTSKIYINPLNMFLSITTKHFTSNFGEPFYKKDVESILNSIQTTPLN